MINMQGRLHDSPKISPEALPNIEKTDKINNHAEILSRTDHFESESNELPEKMWSSKENNSEADKLPEKMQNPQKDSSEVDKLPQKIKASEEKEKTVRDISVEKTKNDLGENSLRRDLTTDEKKKLKEMGMSDSNIEKCKVDENGVYHLKTINDGLEGKKHQVTGIEYARRQIKIKGVTIEGVFPKFDNVFSCRLDNDNLQGTDKQQFNDCIRKLRDAVDADPKLASKFTKRQLDQIHDTDNNIVSGYTWHHNEETGQMELVKTSDHAPTNHTGGKSIWGGGNDNR